ncbi:MAG: hypothetical protein BGO12_10445 [Verrucomicrobia bacterium 61-8]|nr:MAG: hypothetical protein BGO12_10445 [Verrucomicrobia bacterium 61-8]
MLNERDVAFLLPRYDMADEEGDFRRDGLLHRSSTGLADENVMRGHQVGHLVGPADEPAPAWHSRRLELAHDLLAAARDDGEIEIGQLAEGLQDGDGVR